MIVCPLSTLNQWKDEIEEKVKENTLKVLVYHGSKRPDKKEIKKFIFIFLIFRYDIVITTYHIMIREVFDGVSWGNLGSIRWF